MQNVWIHHLFISEGHNYRGRHNLGALDFPVLDLLSIDLIAKHGNHLLRAQSLRTST